MDSGFGNTLLGLNSDGPPSEIRLARVDALMAELADIAEEATRNLRTSTGGSTFAWHHYQNVIGNIINTHSSMVTLLSCNFSSRRNY